MVSKEQLKELIQSIKDATGLGQEDISVEAGYKPTTLTEILSKGERLDAAYKRLERIFRERLKKSISTGGSDKFTADQLFAMFLEVSKAQTAILNSIESKMAREDSLTIIKASLNEALTGVETIAMRQGPAIEKILADLDELKRRKNGPS